MSEEWREVPGFPGYRVSNTGRVQTRRRPVGVWRDLALVTDPKGYRKVTLSSPGRVWQARINRLVAEVFIPNPAGHPIVRHLDGDKTNNNVSNLAWGTYKDNEHDKKRHGKWDIRYTANAKLTAPDVERARELVAAGGTHRAVAAQLGVGKSAITRLISGQTWGPR